MFRSEFQLKARLGEFCFFLDHKRFLFRLCKLHVQLRNSWEAAAVGNLTWAHFMIFIRFYMLYIIFSRIFLTFLSAFFIASKSFRLWILPILDDSEALLASLGDRRIFHHPSRSANTSRTSVAATQFCRNMMRKLDHVRIC